MNDHPNPFNCAAQFRNTSTLSSPSSCIKTYTIPTVSNSVCESRSYCSAVPFSLQKLSLLAIPGQRTAYLTSTEPDLSSTMNKFRQLVLCNFIAIYYVVILCAKYRNAKIVPPSPNSHHSNRCSLSTAARTKHFLVATIA